MNNCGKLKLTMLSIRLSHSLSSVSAPISHRSGWHVDRSVTMRWGVGSTCFQPCFLLCVGVRAVNKIKITPDTCLSSHTPHHMHVPNRKQARYHPYISDGRNALGRLHNVVSMDTHKHKIQRDVVGADDPCWYVSLSEGFWVHRAVNSIIIIQHKEIFFIVPQPGAAGRGEERS